MYRGGGRSERRGSFPRGRGRSSYRGGGGGGRHYDSENELMSKLSRIGGRDSEMALNIVNAVLAAKGGDDYLAPSSKIRRTDRGRGGGSYRGGRSSYSSRGGRSEGGEGRKRKHSGEDEDVVAGENSDGEVAIPDKPAFEVPKAALYCKICNIHSFSSKRAYLEHRDSNFHSEMAIVYQRRSMSVLRLIRGHAKVQSTRKIKEFMESCRICHGTYEDSYQSHKATIDHEIVENFLKWRCCGKFFNSRQEYDDHTLTPFHLVNKFEELKRWNKEQPELTSPPDDIKNGLEMLEAQNEQSEEALRNFEELKKEVMEQYGEDADESTSAPEEYDPTKPIGMRFITGNRVFRCRACVVEIVGENLDAIKSHLKSPDHYFEVLRCIQQKKDLELKKDANTSSKTTTKTEKDKIKEEEEEEEEETNMEEGDDDNKCEDEQEDEEQVCEDEQEVCEKEGEDEDENQEDEVQEDQETEEQTGNEEEEVEAAVDEDEEEE